MSAAEMHGYGGQTHSQGKKLLLVVCFCLLHRHIFSLAEPLPTDTDDFKSLLLNTDTYVDKSLLIEEFLSGRGCCGAIIRPNRWGKSLNMNMLRKFFDLEIYPNGTILPDDLKQNRKLFTGGEIILESNRTKVLKPLKIAANAGIMKKQGTHPVIFFSLKGIDGNYEDFQEELRRRVIDLYKKYEFLTSSSNLTAYQLIFLKKYLNGGIYSANIILSINFLSQLLFKHFGKKVMVFVDDYDAPISSAYQQQQDNPEEYLKVLYFLRSLYVQSFHLNENLEKGLFSGILQLHLLKIVYFYTFLDKKYSKYYGFNQNDLDELLANVSFTPDHPKIKDWYGYKFNDSVQLYNPGSIMRYIAHNGTFEYYWVDTSCTGIDKLLLSDDLQTHLRNLSKGQSITYFANFTDKTNLDSIKPLNRHVFLLFFGFLTPVDGKWGDTDQHELAVANSEVKYLLQIKVLEWVDTKLNMTTNEFHSLVDQPLNVDTPEQKVDQIRTKLQRKVELLTASNADLFQNTSNAKFLFDVLMISPEKSLNPALV